MKTQRNIFIAFILNLSFSVFEFIGGIVTGSVAITSDAVHDLGDAASIGISYILERKSKKQPDEEYTYGYSRYSVIGGFITTLILITGSVMMIYAAAVRLIVPTNINYNGMIIIAIVGVMVNLCAALFTRKGESLNQKAVNLHMIEDVLGWVVVLAGAVLMHFTDLRFIDPVMSMGVSLFILINALKNFNVICGLFLDKTPHGISVSGIKATVLDIKEVQDIHHIHIRSTDGYNNYATMHVVCDGNHGEIKKKIREELKKLGLVHVTIETETGSEYCREKECHVEHHAHLGHICHSHHSH